jgi:membrane protein YdbS with pleckstrin-like domain
MSLISVVLSEKEMSSFLSRAQVAILGMGKVASPMLAIGLIGLEIVYVWGLVLIYQVIFGGTSYDSLEMWQKNFIKTFLIVTLVNLVIRIFLTPYILRA